MIFGGKKLYLPSITLNEWIHQDLNWMTSYTVQYISNWHLFSHLQARNKQEPSVIRDLWAIKSECKSRRVIEIGLPKQIKNSHHADDVTVTAWSHFFDKLCSPSRSNHYPLILYQLLPQSFTYISITCSKFKILLLLSTQNGIFKCS
jgi:hypothetical protein